MKILELEIRNIGNCPHALLQFNLNDPLHAFPVYLIQSDPKCNVVPLSIQLICSNKYDSLLKLHNIRDQVSRGEVILTFSVTKHMRIDAPAPDDDHSSDSDVPCTSRAAQERSRKRQERRRRQTARGEDITMIIKASRNFKVDPEVIEYNIKDGPRLQCPVDIFQQRFFSCTDIMFPHLSELKCSNCCNGRWLDLLGLDFIYKGKGEDHFIIQFCEIYVGRRITMEHQLSQLTTAALVGRNSLNRSRIAQLIYIFQDIRCVFEYITCFEFTVWFMLPTNYGNLNDITQITTGSINFDLMKTKIQLKSPSTSPKFLWTQADGYVQELFLVAVQLAFGYHCCQNVIFLNNLEQLSNHQSFEYIRTAFSRNTHGGLQWLEKNYVQHIVNICTKFDMSCVLEYTGGFPIRPKNAFVIQCRTPKRTNCVTISLKTYSRPDNINILCHNAKKTFKP